MSSEMIAVDSGGGELPWKPVWRDRAELLRLADLTLAEFFRQLARYGTGSRILEEDGLVLFAGSHAQPNPFRNGAIRLDERLSAAEALERAQRFFAPLKRSYVFWVRESESELDALCRSPEHGARGAGRPP